MFYYRLDFVKWDLDRKERKNMKFIICEKFDKKSWLCCDIKRKPQSFAYILFKCTESIQLVCIDLSIGSTETNYIKLNTKTQFFKITFDFCIHFKKETFFSICFLVPHVKVYKKVIEFSFKQ